MPVTPNLQIPYAVGTEFATDYPATVDEPRALLLDALITDTKGVKAAVATGTYSGAPGGSVTVPITTLVQSYGATVWEVSGGALIAPLTGVYQVTVFGSTQNVYQARFAVSADGVQMTSLQVSSAIMGTTQFMATSLHFVTAGSPLPNPELYIETAGSFGDGRIIAVFIGE